MLVDTYAYKDQILQGTGASGAGSQQGTSGQNGGKKTILRSAFQDLNPVEKASKMKDGFEVVDAT